MADINKVVLAYSGGLDTSAIIPWLKENYSTKENDCEVIAFVADVGQGEEELRGIEEKALTSGASSCYVADLKEELVEHYIFPALKTGALYEGKYLLGTAMARPIIAKAQVECALELGADTLCHGCTGKGNDQVRFETTYATLAPELNVIAPWREWTLRSREALLDYLSERNIPTSASLEKIYSRDANAWHVSTEGGVLEDPWNCANEDCWVLTVDPELAPNQAETVTLWIEKGNVVAIDGERMSPFQVLSILNKKGARHGVGRIDIVENRLVGIKSRGCYETPGGTIMMEALRGVEQLVLDKESFQFRQELGLKASQIIYDGQWFTPICQSIFAAADSLAQSVTGEVVVKLYKGQVSVIQKRSINSLYSQEFATFGEDDVYDHRHADGFIRLYSLSSRIRALNEKKQK